MIDSNPSVAPDTGPAGGPAHHYALVARVIARLSAAAGAADTRAAPSLDDLAQAVGLSPFHLQRVFQEWAGVSPKRFIQFLTKERALTELRAGAPVLQAAHEAGLSGSGRLHDLLISWEAMTPGEARQGGAGLTLRWAWAPTPVGWGLAALSPRGLCHLSLSDGPNAVHEQEMRALWPQAAWAPDASAVAAVLAQAFGPQPQARLLLRGTPFQLKVWEALIRTEPGRVLSYSDLARRCGHPKAARAIGTAMAANTVAVLVPCHRVIRESADIGQYRWGPVRKHALQAWEARERLQGAA
jgi:AraC family transcriptional regulator of adaptative response/methylated-DNA-[protein]-cysteine methyltransferase